MDAVLTIGVDLAAQPAGTGVAAIEWLNGVAVLRSVEIGATDEHIVSVSEGADAIGIDCPFGWPREFARFVAAHVDREVSPRQLSGTAWRRRLAYRETDRVARDVTGRWPLSVSTDRLGLTAMRCAELLELFASGGEEVDRSGEGRLVEVYPAASLRLWGIDVAGYKTSTEACARVAGALRSRVPWLSVDDQSFTLISRNNDALDAVVAALIARAHATGRTGRVPADLAETAQAEGWIALPTGDIGSLVGSSPQP